jgi:hypothetical protein
LPPRTIGSTLPAPRQCGTLSAAHGAAVRQANRLFAARATGPVDRTARQTISAEGIRASRVFHQ